MGIDGQITQLGLNHDPAPPFPQHAIIKVHRKTLMTTSKTEVGGIVPQSSLSFILFLSFFLRKILRTNDFVGHQSRDMMLFTPNDTIFVRQTHVNNPNSTEQIEKTTATSR